MKTKFFTHQSKQSTHRHGACAKFMSLFITLLVFCGSIAAFGVTFFAPNASVVHAAPAPVDSAQQTRFQAPPTDVTITLQESQYDDDLGEYPPIEATGKLEIYDSDGTLVLTVDPFTTDTNGEAVVDLSSLTSDEYYDFSFTGFDDEGYGNLVPNKYVDDFTTTITFYLNDVPSVTGTLYDASSCYYDYDSDEYVCTPIADTTGTLTFYPVDPTEATTVTVEVKTDAADGMYDPVELPDLVIGEQYVIGFSGFDGYVDDQYSEYNNATTFNFDEAEPFYISSEEETINANLQKIPSVTGTLRDSSVYDADDFQYSGIADTTGTITFYDPYDVNIVLAEVEVTTDGDGMYDAGNQPDLVIGEEYVIGFSGFEGFADNQYYYYYLDLWDDEEITTFDFDNADSVNISAGEENTVNARLKAEFHIHGVLQDPDGNAIANATGDVTFKYGSGDYSDDTQTFTTTADGSYTVTSYSLEAGRAYRLWYSGFDDDGATGYPDQYHDGADGAILSFYDAPYVWLYKGDNDLDASTLHPSVLVNGTLRNAATNAPIANTEGTVTLYIDDYNSIDFDITTNANGGYELKVLANTYRVQFDMDGYPEQYYDSAEELVTARDDAEAMEWATGSHTLDAKLQPYATINGTLLDATTNKPIANANGSVEIYGDTYEVETNAQGTFTITQSESYWGGVTRIMPGEYMLEFSNFENDGAYGYPDQYYNEAGKLVTGDYYYDVPDAADEVELKPGDNTLSIKLTPYAHVTGTLLDAYSNEPIANASGRLYFNDDYWWDYHWIETDANGIYQSTKTYELMPGNYTFWYAYFEDYGYPGQYHDKQLDEDAAVEVTLQPGDNAITSHLLRGACLSGNITDAQTTEVITDASLDINYYNATYGGWLGWLGGYLQDDGSYTTGSNLLPAGSHKLEFITDGYNSRFYDDDDVMKDAEIVTVPDDGGTGWPGQCISGIDIALFKSSTVKGTVTDALTGDPIANTTLHVYFYCTDECDAGPESYEVETDDQGTYTLEGIQQGTYNVRFSIDDNKYQDLVWYNNTYDITKRTVLTVERGQTHDGVDVAFQPLGQVKGTVTNAQGEGIEGVEVCLQNTTYSSYSSCIAKATTDKDGKYTLKSEQYGEYGYESLEGVEAGVYTLRFDPDADGYGSDYLQEYHSDKGSSATADTLTVAWGETTTIDATLAGAMELTVNVKDSDGEPIENAWLQLYDAASPDSTSDWYNDYNDYEYNTPSDQEDGTYTFTGLYPGRYRLWSEAGTYKSQWYNGIETEKLDVEGQQFQQATVIDLTNEDATVDVTLNNGGSGEISGYVNDEKTGAPIEDAWVTLYDAFSGDYLRSTDTDEDGQYEFKGLNGTYKLRFSADCYVPEYFDNSTMLEDATIVSALDGETATADAALVYSGRIGVALKGGDTNAPVAYAYVTAENVATGARYFEETYEAGTVIIDVPAGDYRLYVEATGNYAAYEGTGTHTVATEQQIGVDVVLQASGSVVGRVTDADTGLPIEDAWVDLYYDSFELYADYDAQTDSMGHYIIPGVEAGSYHVKVYADGYKAQFHENKAEWADGTAINVTDGEKTTVNAALQLGGAVGGFVGRVTRSVGDSVAPANAVEVIVHDAATGEPVGSDITSSNGDYDITVDVENSSGSYNVRYMPPNGSGFAMEWYNDKASRTNADSESLTKGKIKTLNVVLEAASGAIDGTVTAADTGDALPNVEVTAYDATTGERVGYDYTNRDGAYSITGLRDGSYVVESGSSDEYSGHYFNAKADWASANAVTVAGGTPATADFTLHKAGIKGTVKSSDGRGVPEVTVYFDRIQGGFYETTTDADGAFSRLGLPAGNYYVHAYPHYVPGFVDTWFGNTADRDESTIVAVGIDGVKEAPITLLESASLSGKVVDEDTGEGLPGVWVELNWGAGMYTNAQGEYSFTDLYPSSYSISLSFPDRGAMSVYPDQWYDRVVNAEHAQWVGLEAGEDKNLTIPASRTPSEYGLNAFGVDVSPATDARLGVQGGSVTYQLNVTNIGSLEDTYTVSATSEWDSTVSQTVGPLPSGASTTVNVEVAVPQNAGNGESDQATVTVISQGDSTKTDGAKLTTTASDVAPPPAGEIIIAPSAMTQMGNPGAEITYNLQVINVGDATETISVAVESKWDAVVTPTSMELGAKQRSDLTVKVTIPEDASDGDVGETTVTVAAHGESAKQDKADLKTQAVKGVTGGIGVRVAPLSAAASSVPGMYVQYTVEVCNTSNVSDTLNMTTSGTWNTELSTDTLELASGRCANVVVKTTIPKTATGEESDDTVLTITSEQSDASAEATLKTEVATQSKLVEPGLAASFDSDDGRVNLAFTGLAKLTRFMYTPLVTPTQDVSGLGTGMSYFLVEAVDVATGQKIQQLEATEQVTLTIKYTTEELEELGITGSTLRAYVWDKDSQQWVQLTTTSNAASLAAEGSISLPIDRLGEIAFLGTGKTTVYLPVIMR